MAALLSLTGSPLAATAATNASAQLAYKLIPYVHVSVVPNYATSFGVTTTSGGGSGVTPATGSTAVLDGGQVDFGNVVAGYNYLYKYAAEVNVNTNDGSGFVVYAEGATNLYTPTASTFPLAQTLFWAVSSSANTPFTSAASFNATTTGTPIGANGSGGISYSGAPSAGAIVWQSASGGTVSQGYDYQLRVNDSIPTSQFNVYIVYTVIGN
ncbi:MAG: hypothetical protein ABR975_07125 [Vulcanimicrobiaceae bacterium]|jgi:hypothetical protein